MASLLDIYTPPTTAPRTNGATIPGLDTPEAPYTIPGLEQPISDDPGIARSQQRQLSNAVQQLSARELVTKQQQDQVAAAQARAKLTAQNAIPSYASDPRTTGKAWHELHPDIQSAIQTAHPTLASELPGMWNQYQSVSTGRPVGAKVGQDEIVSGEVPGGFKFQNIQPTDSSGTDATGQPSTSNKEQAVQGILKRSIPLTTLGRGNDPFKRAVIAEVMRRDPQWSAQDYDAQHDARKSFVGQGKNAQSIIAANTVVDHFGQVNDLVDQLNNSGWPIWNQIANPVAKGMGNTAITKFQTAAQTAATEYAKMLAGGVPNESEIKHYQSMLDPNLGPQQLKQNIQQMAMMMGSKLRELENEWNTSVRAPRDVPFLTGNSPQTLQRLGVNIGMIDPVSAGAQGPTGAPQPVQLPPAATGPSPDRVALANRALADPNASPAHKAAAKAILGIK